MSKKSKLIYFIIAALFFSYFDFYFSNLLINTRFRLPENPVFDLIFVQNTGAAFSILENAHVFLITFALLAIALILIYICRNVEKFSTFASLWSAILVAGIGCNLYERIAFGYVRDFIKLNFVDFPVFNISDLFINISVIALIIIIIKNKYLKNK